MSAGVPTANHAHGRTSFARSEQQSFRARWVACGAQLGHPDHERDAQNTESQHEAAERGVSSKGLIAERGGASAVVVPKLSSTGGSERLA